MSQHEEKELAAAERSAVAEFETPESAPRETEPETPISEIEPVSAFARDKGRWGSREVEIEDVSLYGDDGTGKHIFSTGEPVTVCLKVKSTGTIKDFVFGVAIFNADGVCCYGTNTDLEELEPVTLSGEGEVRFVIPKLQLIEGTYFLDVAAHQKDGYPFDYHRALHQFRVQSRVKDVGVYRPTHRWEFTSNIVMRPRKSSP